MAIKSTVQSQFSKSAEAYAASPVHAKGASLQRLVDVISPKPEWRLLDVATGPGHTAFVFAPHVAEVIATDLTPRMLEVARGLAAERGISNVTFQEADGEALPFGDGSFDCVTCRIAPHHFERIDLFLSEVKRVLISGGRFGLVDNVAPDTRSTPGFPSEDLKAAAADFNAFERLRDPGHVKALQFTQWMEALEVAGLQTLHHELIEKPMAFQPWAERLGADSAAIADLCRMVHEGSTALRAFLKPEERDDGLWMTWTEALIVAENA